MRLIPSSERRNGAGSRGELHHPSCGYATCMGPVIGLKCLDALPHRDTLSIPSMGSSRSQLVMSCGSGRVTPYMKRGDHGCFSERRGGTGHIRQDEERGEKEGE